MSTDESKADLVSIEQGTDSTVDFSNGNTLPLCARPFGHAHFGPETLGADTNRWYHPSAGQFVGYRLTHQPSPWIGDYGWLRVGFNTMRSSENCATSGVGAGRSLRPTPFTRKAADGWHLSPYACSVPLQTSAGTVLFELTPTERCALLRLTLPAGTVTSHLLIEFPAARGRSSVSIDTASGCITGKTAHHNGGADASFGCYFSIQVETTLTGCGVWADDEVKHGVTSYPEDAAQPGSAISPQLPPVAQSVLPHGSEANGDELWVGRVVHGGVPHAGKTRPAFGGLNYSHEGRAACVQSGYEVLKVVGTYQWVEAHSGDVPAGAVSVGALPGSGASGGGGDGGHAYVARGACGGGKHPGELVSGVGCIVEYGGRGVTLQTYEVLVLGPGGDARAEWVGCADGVLPALGRAEEQAAAANAPAGSTMLPPVAQSVLPHGSEANGDELWVGRVVHGGVPHAGKTRPAFGGLNYSHEGRAACVQSGYEVLKVVGTYQWVEAHSGDVPAGAVSVGALPGSGASGGGGDGGHAYVARGACGGGKHPGELVSGVGCIVEYGGRGVTLQTYEVLVLGPGGDARAEWVGCADGVLPALGRAEEEAAAAAGAHGGATPRQPFRRKGADFAGGFVELAGSEDSATIVLVRLGSSFISVGQAAVNARRELGARGFDETVAEGRAVWDSTTALGAIEITAPQEEEAALTAARRRTFYSCLYRTMLFPRMLHEVDPTGAVVHFSPFSHRVERGVLYTDNGFWDTHRTCYPLLTLLVPSRVAEMVAGFINGAREGGWLPKWASPGYRACMIGTHIDNIVADAVSKGLHRTPSDGSVAFDVAEAYSLLRKNAFELGDPAGCYGRVGVREYDSLGYVPADAIEHAAARTLDFAYNDWGVLQVGKHLGEDSPAVLGKADELDTLARRAQHYRNTFEPEQRMARGRRKDGSWTEQREFEWGGAHIEGGVWQCTWGVPHDPVGLAEVMGGPEAVVAQLDTMFSLPPRYEVGSYGHVIHEMAEMADLKLGQYNHGNQPQHNCIYLYTVAGKAPHKTQQWVRHVCSQHYTAAADGLPGDEDNGEMCAWYILSAIGLYQTCPGLPIYTIGSPLVARAALHTDGRPSAVVEALANSDARVYVQLTSSTLNGQRLGRSWVTYRELVGGGRVSLSMVATPDAASAALPHWPPS